MFYPDCPFLPLPSIERANAAGVSSRLYEPRTSDVGLMGIGRIPLPPNVGIGVQVSRSRSVCRGGTPIKFTSGIFDRDPLFARVEIVGRDSITFALLLATEASRVAFVASAGFAMIQ